TVKTKPTQRNVGRVASLLVRFAGAKVGIFCLPAKSFYLQITTLTFPAHDFKTSARRLFFMPPNIFSPPRNPLWTGVWGEWLIVNFCSIAFPKGRFSERNVKTVF
ncbi:MAG: hypothetical protein MR401_02960, partial [Bacteroidales bacterium]|nr:hypothetical protein [Bacteroidales bacterium]